VVVSLHEPPRPPLPRVPQLSCHRRRCRGCCQWSSSAIGGGGVAHRRRGAARQGDGAVEGGWVGGDRPLGFRVAETKNEPKL
jgi:hypothetical protein